MGGFEFNCFNVKSGVLYNRMNRSQRHLLRLGSCLLGSSEWLDFVADILCFKAGTIQPSPPVAFHPVSIGLDTERQFAVLALRRKLRTKSWRNFTTNKDACFTRIECRSTPLLVSKRSGDGMSCWSRWGAGFTPVPLSFFWISGRVGSGLEEGGAISCLSQRRRNLLRAGLEKEFVAQQESRFVT